MAKIEQGGIGCSVLCKFAETSCPQPDTLVIYCTAQGQESARIWFAQSDPEKAVMKRPCIAVNKKGLKDKPSYPYMSEEEWKRFTREYYWPSQPYGGVDPFAIGDSKNADEL